MEEPRFSFLFWCCGSAATKSMGTIEAAAFFRVMLQAITFIVPVRPKSCEGGRCAFLGCFFSGVFKGTKTTVKLL